MHTVAWPLASRQSHACANMSFLYTHGQPHTHHTHIHIHTHTHTHTYNRRTRTRTTRCLLCCRCVWFLMLLLYRLKYPNVIYSFRVGANGMRAVRTMKSHSRIQIPPERNISEFSGPFASPCKSVTSAVGSGGQSGRYRESQPHRQTETGIDSENADAK